MVIDWRAGAEDKSRVGGGQSGVSQTSQENEVSSGAAASAAAALLRYKHLNVGVRMGGEVV